MNSLRNTKEISVSFRKRILVRLRLNAILKEDFKFFEALTQKIKTL